MFGFGCNRNVLCSVVSSVGMLVYIVVCREYICFIASILVVSVLLFGNNGGNTIGVWGGVINVVVTGDLVWGW